MASEKIQFKKQCDDNGAEKINSDQQIHNSEQRGFGEIQHSKRDN